MAFTPPMDELDELYDGQAAYIMSFEESLEGDYDSLMNPTTPTEAKPGSEDKVQMLAARYAAGLPLWHDSDCYDHGPESQDLDGEEEELDLMDELEQVR